MKIRIPLKVLRKSAVTLFLVALLLLGVNYTPVAYGSIFGEENATLVQIFVQTMQAKEELQKLNDAAEEAADLTEEMVDNYQRIMAGVEELQSYSWDSFRQDVLDDFNRQYPGFAKLKGASRRLEHWDDARSSRPWTSYQAISAVLADVSAPLRKDIDDGKVNVDEELILGTEASLGFADVSAALDATEDLDEERRELASLYRKKKGPASAQMITAEATLLVAKQNSQILRLLSRTVTFQSLDHAIDYGRRMRSRDTYKDRASTARFFDKSLSSPTLIDFGRR